MKLRLEKSFSLGLFEEEDLHEAITQTAEKGRIEAGFFFLIGTLKKAKMGFFHQGRYQPIEMAEPLETVSCMENLSIKETNPLFTLISRFQTEKAKSSAVTSCLAA